jgi:hypothetical protein
LSQRIFGGRHEDAWDGTVESQAFEIELPLKVPPRERQQIAAAAPPGWCRGRL